MRDLDELNKLEDIFSKNIEEIEKLEKGIKANTDEFAELCKLGHDLFSTKSGGRFLDLLSGYLNHPVSPANGTERYACVREGHNEIIRLLMRMQKFIPKQEKING